MISNITHLKKLEKFSADLIDLIFSALYSFICCPLSFLIMLLYMFVQAQRGFCGGYKLLGACQRSRRRRRLSSTPDSRFLVLGQLSLPSLWGGNWYKCFSNQIGQSSNQIGFILGLIHWLVATDQRILQIHIQFAFRISCGSGKRGVSRNRSKQGSNNAVPYHFILYRLLYGQLERQF